MPALPKTGPSLFLGIELGIDQLRASIVDESLELVGVESIDFDTELPEYQCVFSQYPFPRPRFVPHLVSSSPMACSQDDRRDIHDPRRGVHDTHRDVA